MDRLLERIFRCKWKKVYHILSGIHGRWCMPGHNWYQSNFWMPYVCLVFRNYTYLIPVCSQSGMKQSPPLTPLSPGWLVADVFLKFSCMVSVLSTAALMASQGHQENIECLSCEDCNLLQVLSCLLFLRK